MATAINPMHQPTPEQFSWKHSQFERIRDMALEMQRMRRALGYQWLEGGLSAMEGTDQVIVHAKQSGLITVTVADPVAQLHMEPASRPLSHDDFHRSVLSRAHSVAEFRLDEAMLTERMT